MTATFKMTRRAALTTAVAAPFIATGATSFAQVAQNKGPQIPRANRVNVGNFEVNTLLVGTRTVENPKGIFGLNASDEDFAQASAKANLPTDKAQFFFTPTLVNTGSDLILFDTGLNQAGIQGAVKAAGYAPEDVSHVVITHMHGDHIGGLMDGNTESFANAAYITGQKEYDFWAKAENEGFEAKMRPLAEKVAFLDAGADVTSGVTSVEAFGHSPGHMGYMLESEGQQLLLAADAANHYIWSLAYPDWEVRFDMDKTAAAATRRNVFSMLAADKVPFVGYHMPFPGIGYVEQQGDGFAYVPHSYQLMMG